MEILALDTPAIMDVNVVQREVEQDEELQKIIRQLEENLEGTSKYQLKNGKLWYKGRLVLSRRSLIPSLLHTFHDSIMGGHSRFLRNVQADDRRAVLARDENGCQKTCRGVRDSSKEQNGGCDPAGLLQPLPIPDRI